MGDHLQIETEERQAQELRKKCQNIVVLQINEKAQDTVIPLPMGSEDGKSRADSLDGASGSKSCSPHRMAGYLGHRPSNYQMHPEEIRLNRRLLEKISQKRR